MVRVVHYINQFFGQIGGEEKADVAPSMVSRAVGPGVLIDKGLEGHGQVVATVMCGDTYFAEHTEEAATEIVGMISTHKPDMLIAGPAFNAGRYGIACAEVCKRAQVELQIPCVTGMFPENPGVELCRKMVYIIETTGNAAGMGKAMPKMVSLAFKLYRGEPVGRPSEEGYIPRGIRKNVVDTRMAALRAVDLLLRKMKGEAFETEIACPDLDKVEPPPPITDLSGALIALVTEGGLVPTGNPDNLPYARATRYEKYSIRGIDTFDGEHFMCIHRGIDRKYINERPNRLLPLDAMRDLEREGLFKELLPQYFVTTGVATTMANASKIGQGIAQELKAQGVSGVVLTST
jgi:glycine reductase complex component B subunit gamma